VIEERADVADEDGLEVLLRRIDDTMPPLAGVVHAAMVLDDGVVLQLSDERLERVMAPKILGAWNLHRLTLQRPLDFFIMCSSFTSMTGNPGQGNYAAANAFLDSLAHYRRSRGLSGLCVNWGSIKDVGYIARTAHLGDTLSRLGVQGISVDHAMQILGRLIRSDAAQIGVMSIDWPQLVEYIASLKTIRRFSLVLASSSDGRETATSAGQLRDRLMHQTAEERRATLLAFLREHAAKVLRTTPAAIDTERALADLGLDSLMAVELSNRLEGELGVALPMGKLTAGESLARLVDLLMDVLHSARAAAATA
jgi:acyl carrier protein